MKQRSLLSVRAFQQRYSAIYPSESSVRWAIFHEATNGLREAGAVLRQGRRVFIDEDRWFRWLDKTNGVDAEKVAA